MVYNKTSTGFTMDVWNAASAYPNITCTINWIAIPLQYSVSQWCLIAHNSGTSYAPYSADDLSKYKMVSLVAATKEYRPLASTVFMIDFLTMYCTSADKAAACIYAPEPNAYSANVYYQNSKIYIKSTSTRDTALLIAF